MLSAPTVPIQARWRNAAASSDINRRSPRVVGTFNTPNWAVSGRRTARTVMTASVNAKNANSREVCQVQAIQATSMKAS